MQAFNEGVDFLIPDKKVNFEWTPLPPCGLTALAITIVSNDTIVHFFSEQGDPQSERWTGSQEWQVNGDFPS